MSDWLLYWKEHSIQDDYEPVSDRWHTKQKDFFRQVQRGDSLWVVVNGGIGCPEQWLLYERMLVLGKKLKSTPRQYCVFGDRRRSERFVPTRQADLEPLLHKIQFVTGRKIRAQGRLIGRSLQTIRRLSEADALLLENYARKLARLYEKAMNRSRDSGRMGLLDVRSGRRGDCTRRASNTRTQLAAGADELGS